jgi:hypothetical protein
MMLFLSRLDLLMPESPFFMFEGREVVDSLAESPICVGTQIEQELEAPARNRRNQTIKFGNLEDQFCRDQQQSGASLGFDKDASPSAN